MNRIRRVISNILIIAFLFTSIIMPSGSVLAAKQETLKVKKEKVQILVKYNADGKAESVKTKVKDKLKLSRLESKKKYNRTRIEVLEIDDSDNINNVVAELKKDPNVEFVQANHKLKALAVDERYDEQWGLKNNGQTIQYSGGTAGVDVNAEKGWETTMGDSSVLVGVLDTGVDINHSDLKANIYTNTNEIPDNGLDDDGNGYVDDINGWDFANEDGTVFDSTSSDTHGTHVSGIIAAGANSIGIRGVAPKVKILPLKFISNGEGYTSDAIDAIEYAKQMGAKIINCSFGGTEDNPALEDEMEASGILFVCAAGNNKARLDESPVYPAAFNITNKLAVAAINNDGDLANFSNYGTGVDVAAPGVSILSTIPDDMYGYMSGTSMAAPFVSGIAALISSTASDMTGTQLASRIKNSVKKLDSLDGKVASGGIVNAEKSLDNATDGSAPADQASTSTTKTNTKSSMVIALAATVSQALQEQIHFGEDGVSASTGNFSKSCTDLSVPAPGFDVNIVRTYNSKDTRATSTMGRGWTFGFEGSLKQDTTDTTLWVATLPNGAAQNFVLSGGVYTANDSHSTLVKNADGSYVLTTKDEYTYGFSSAGWISWMKDRNGNTINILVDGSGKVQKITDSAAREYNVAYNAQTMISCITDPMGRTIKYQYDASNRLWKVTDLNNNVVAVYEYDSSNYLTTLKDGLNNTTGYIVYDHASGSHKVSTYKDANGNTDTYSYDTANRITTITDSNGRITKKWFDTAMYVIKSQDTEYSVGTTPNLKQTIVEYYTDANGFNKYGEEKSITDRNGNKTQYIRDANGNITQIINPDNTSSYYTYDEKNNLTSEKDETGRTTCYIYDANKINLLKKVQPLNGTDAYSADADQSKYSITSYIYYSDAEAAKLGYIAKGLLKSESDPEHNTKTYTYDAYGNKASETDSENNTTYYTYDKVGELKSTVSPSGYSTTNTYDAAGRLERKVLDNGEATRYLYDIMGNKIQEIMPNLYDPKLDGLNSQTPTHTYLQPSLTNVSGNTVDLQYYYQKNVKEVASCEADEGWVDTGIGGVGTYQADSEKHKVGNAGVKSIVSSENAGAHINKTIDLSKFNDGTTSTEDDYITFDLYIAQSEINKMDSTTGALYVDFASATGYWPTNWWSSGTLKNNLVPGWNSIKLKKSSFYSGGTKDWSAVKQVMTRYWAASGTVTNLTWTVDNIQLVRKDPLTDAPNPFQKQINGTWTRDFSINSGSWYIGQEFGQLTCKNLNTSGCAQLGYTYTYNAAGKVLTETDPENYTTTYTYDIYGNKITETKPNGSIYLYEYDVMNRLKKESFRSDANAVPVALKEYSYGILADGRTTKTETEYLNGSESAVTTYTYDYDGKALEQQNPDNTKTSTTYYANGEVATTTDANGSTTYMKYDGLNNPSETWTPAQPGLYSYSAVTYYKNGKKKEEKTGKDNVELFSVPVSDRLITKTYTYYRTGNLKSVTDSAGSKTTYSYDPDGNISREDDYTSASSADTTEYTYNHLGKPVTKKVHVKAGDLSGNSIDNTTDVELVTKYTYDLNGNLKTQTEPDGVTTTYSYDKLNRKTGDSKSGLDENGQPVTITTSATYNWDDKVLTQTDENAHTTTNEYDLRGFLVKTTNAKSGVTLYAYDTAGRKTAEVSPLNYDAAKTIDQMDRTVYAYDKLGRVITKTEIYHEKKVDPATYQWLAATAVSTVVKAYKYDANGNIIKELDGEGYKTGAGTTVDAKINSGYGIEYKYTLSNRPEYFLDAVSKERGIKYTKKFEYDGAGRKTAETDADGYVTCYAYDDAGRTISISVKKSEGSPEQVIKSNTYDLAGNPLTETDGNGNTTKFEYNALGKVRKAIYPGDASIPEFTVTSQYDESGNLTREEDSTGKVNLYTYDNEDRQLSAAEQDRTGKQSITTFTRYDKSGNKRFTVDGNGNTTENLYDELDRLTGTKVYVTNLDGVKTLQYTQFAYDANGNQTTVNDWRGNVATNVYDTLNRLVEKIDANSKSIQKLEFNAANLQMKSYGSFNGTTSFCTQFAYDKNNRLITTTDPEGHITRQDYDNCDKVASKTDGRGNVTRYGYDQFDRVIKVTAANGDVTTYSYDLCGNMLTQTDGSGNTALFEYNARNKLVRRIDAGGRTGAPDKYTYISAKVESYTYLADGSMATTIDRNGKTTVNTYDVHGRLLSEAIDDQKISYTYDKNGSQLTMTDNTGATARTYDELGRVMAKYIPGAGSNTYKYDVTTGLTAGWYAEIFTDVKGNVVTKTYDKAGRLKEVKDGSNLPTVYEYYDNGSRKSVAYAYNSANGANKGREDYTYYSNSLLNTLTNKKADGSVLESFQYWYDNSNNQVQKHDSKGDTFYIYDSLNRLQKVTEPSGRITAYAFDRAGNRETETLTEGAKITTTRYTYNEQNRLLNTFKYDTTGVKETTVYTYDNNGNMTGKSLESSRTINPAAPPTTKYWMYFDGEGTQNPNVPASILSGTASYEYDVWNQMVKASTGDGITENKYNGEGLRVEKTVNGVTTRYIYESDKVVLELSDKGVQTGRNIQGINLLTRVVDGLTLNYFYNGHADVTALMNADGTLAPAATYYYDAFGNVLEQTGSVRNNITYAGYQWDKETGLYYLNSRMYDSKIARFLQEDTERGDPNDPLTLNLYAYCHNEPVMYDDPDGHMAMFRLKKHEDNNSNTSGGINFSGLWNKVKTAGGDLWNGAKQAVAHPVDTLKGIGNSIVKGGSEVIKLTSYTFWSSTGNTQMANQAWYQTSSIQEKVSKNIGKNVKSSDAYNFGNNLGDAAQLASGIKGVAGGTGKALSGAKSFTKSSEALEISGTGRKATNIFKEESPLIKKSSTSSKGGSEVGGSSRAANKLKSDSAANGSPHSTFKTDPKTNEVKSYQTYKTNPQNPNNGLDIEKRYDGTGKGHTNTVTGQKVETPHVHDSKTPGGVRKPTPYEIPKKGGKK